MARNKAPVFTPQSRLARLFASLLALLVWQLAAALVGNRLLLVGPVQVLARLVELVQTREFWEALGFTFSRITLGFLVAFCLALMLAALAARFPLAETLIHPYMAAVKTVPVASFIVIALLWLSGRRLSIFISFLMVLPVLYANFLTGIRGADGRLLEMARVFHMNGVNRIRCIYLPALEPHCLSGCRSALGLCWKAGVAAEVIGVCRGSVGGMLYDAKVYLEISDLFAWTLMIVLLSVGFEWVFLRLLSWMMKKAEGC